jgi:hypothetical protein
LVVGLFYAKYPICQKASGKLSWSHYVELVSIDDDLARNFLRKSITSVIYPPQYKRQKSLQNVLFCKDFFIKTAIFKINKYKTFKHILLYS